MSDTFQVYGGVESFVWINIKADRFKVRHDGTLVLYRYCVETGLHERVEAFAPGRWRRVMEPFNGGPYESDNEAGR